MEKEKGDVQEVEDFWERGFGSGKMEGNRGGKDGRNRWEGKEDV